MYPIIQKLIIVFSLFIGLKCQYYCDGMEYEHLNYSVKYNERNVYLDI